MEQATSQPSPPSGSGASPGPDLSGRVLGDFLLLHRLGQGGMGQVYKAEQVSLKRKVALKILKPELAGDPHALRRFKLEAEAVARATHANIVQVYAIGEDAGLHYMALEYVEGRNLRDHLARRGTVDLPLALGIMRQVAAALQRAAEMGLVHRDIKPDNILLTRKGEVKVADFGLSRILAGDRPPVHLTQSGMTMGTPLYMSPEQVEGNPVDARSDIYSFGVTCYHMLAGRTPFQGQGAFEVALQHVRGEAPPLAGVRPDLPAEVCAVVHKMMARDPNGRYPTCRDLLKDLARLREHLAAQKTQAVTAAPPVTATRAVPTEKLTAPWRHRTVALVAGSVLLALATGGVAGWLRNRPVADAAPVAGVEEAGEAPSAAGRREKFLLAAVEEYANPKNDSRRLELGVLHRIELGLHYLDQWRLDAADRFFLGQVENEAKVKPYVTLGRLGRAMVLAFRNQARESNEAFLEVLAERGTEAARERNRLLLANPQLRQALARALDYNAANLPEAQMPAILQNLRKPGPIQPAGKAR